MPRALVTAAAALYPAHAMSDDSLITSLTGAIEARPDDLTLRLHLGGLLVDAGRAVEAVAQAGLVLARDPGNTAAQALMQRALAAAAPGAAVAGPEAGAPATGPGAEPPDDGDPLAAYEQELAPVVPPRYVSSEQAPGPLPAGGPPEPVRGGEDRAFDVESSGVRLADVGGMTEVKERLELAFLGPMRNPELRKLYGKSLRGGLMLYGPPGCGKTFIARAVAGEMGARFMSLSIVDVLDMWLGNSERNLHELFQTARRNAPCVLFLDEIDALGQKRSHLHSQSMRTVANQLLAELDGVDTDNEGVFVLAATNTPWQVDPALRRPGRLDRMVLVLPPDAEARRAIIERNLRDRPIAGIDCPGSSRRPRTSPAPISPTCASRRPEYAMADSVPQRQDPHDRATRRAAGAEGGTAVHRPLVRHRPQRRDVSPTRAGRTTTSSRT
ncbi:ATP-binding protein [Amorphoplanes nipponensis]